MPKKALGGAITEEMMRKLEIDPSVPTILLVRNSRSLDVDSLLDIGQAAGIRCPMLLVDDLDAVKSSPEMAEYVRWEQGRVAIAILENLLALDDEYDVARLRDYMRMHLVELKTTSK